MATEKNYYTIDPEGKLTCMKCRVKLVKGKAKFMYLDNGFPVELPVCPKCGFAVRHLEDLTQLWREYYLEALWTQENVCLPKGKKFSYILFVCERM